MHHHHVYTAVGRRGGQVGGPGVPDDDGRGVAHGEQAEVVDRDPVVVVERLGGDGDALGGVDERLGAALGEVDDRQPVEPEDQVGVVPGAVHLVRTAVTQAIHRLVDRGDRGRGGHRGVTGSQEPEQSAHRRKYARRTRESRSRAVAELPTGLVYAA